jgi:hypothetical protein
MKTKSTKGRTTASRRRTASKAVAPSKAFGRVLNSDKLLEQEIEFIFEERDPAGNQYDFYLGKITRMPIVRNRTTGRFFILPWTDIIQLGAQAGL